MPFQKGHGQLARNPGRKKKATTLIKERLRQLEVDELPGVFDNLVELAQGKTGKCPHCGGKIKEVTAAMVEAAKYLIDRILGKPKEHVEVRHSLNADDLFLIFERAREVEAEYRLVNEPPLELKEPDRDEDGTDTGNGLASDSVKSVGVVQVRQDAG